MNETTPQPVRHFQRYTTDHRADRAASHRMGHQQRKAVGEYFWTHEWCPGIAFKSRKAAMSAALRRAEGGGE